jgi:hypothetical protein
MSELRLEYVSVSELVPYDKNPRKNDAAAEKVAELIKEYGFKKPILVDIKNNKNEIIAGHTRLKAALQEKMTNEIADYIEQNLHPKGCMVVVEASHDCMRIRGVKKQSSCMVTSAVRGDFLTDSSLKDEFMRFVA